MGRPRICAVIVSDDIKAVREVEPFVELFEVRIDLIGDRWQELVEHLRKPWIACNRSAGEGGSWRGNEQGRIGELIKAAGLGADIIDIELGTEKLSQVVQLVNKKSKCLLSFHEMKATPPLDRLKKIVQRQLEAGADICKVITTARSLEDNLTVLRLIAEFPKARIVSFAIGSLGLASRVLCPLVGGDFTYASIERGKESASGQITARELRKLYEMVRNGE